MRNLVNIFEKVFSSNDEFVRQAQNYSKVLKTEEWSFLVNAIQLIKGQMSVDMFSREYTTLSESDKDVLQKTYYQTMLILEFLDNPHVWFTKKQLYKLKLADQAKNTSRQMGGTSW